MTRVQLFRCRSLVLKVPKKSRNLSHHYVLVIPWRSLDKEESLTGLPDNFPIQQKDRWFCGQNFNFYFKKTTQLIVEWRSLDGVFSTWQNLEPTLANIYVLLGKF